MGSGDVAPFILYHQTKIDIYPRAKTPMLPVEFGRGWSPTVGLGDSERKKITFQCVNRKTIVLCLARSWVTIPTELSQLFKWLSYQTFLYSILAMWYCSLK
jgi:hypothetical protein